MNTILSILIALILFDFYQKAIKHFKNIHLEIFFIGFSYWKHGRSMNAYGFNIIRRSKLWLRQRFCDHSFERFEGSYLRKGEKVFTKYKFEHKASNNDYKEFKIKHIVGSRPEGMAGDWMTGDDWKKFDEYIERTKRNGTYGKEVEITLLLKKHPLFSNSGITLDLNNLTKVEFKPDQTT